MDEVSPQKVQRETSTKAFAWLCRTCWTKGIGIQTLDLARDCALEHKRLTGHELIVTKKPGFLVVDGEKRIEPSWQEAV